MACWTVWAQAKDSKSLPQACFTVSCSLPASLLWAYWRMWRITWYSSSSFSCSSQCRRNSVSSFTGCRIREIPGTGSSTSRASTRASAPSKALAVRVGCSNTPSRSTFSARSRAVYSGFTSLSHPSSSIHCRIWAVRGSRYSRAAIRPQPYTCRAVCQISS